MYKCSICGKECNYVYRTNTDKVCSGCLWANEYKYCELCDTYYLPCEYNNEKQCCNDCVKKGYVYFTTAIGEYHSHKELSYIGKSEKQWRNKWRGLGVELEIENNVDNDTQDLLLASLLLQNFSKHLYLEYDGSIDYGFEIISNPHTEKEFYKCDWKSMLDICKSKGYVSHDAETCGLHIHISRYMFGATKNKQDTALAKVIHFYESNWNDILIMSRRTEEQANNWASNYCIRNRKEVIELIKKGTPTRYYAINNKNKHTVEFRLGRGTLNYNTFIAWIDFTLTLVKNSKNILWKDIDNIDLWLNGKNKLKTNTVNYIKGKGIFTALKGV